MKRQDQSLVWARPRAPRRPPRRRTISQFRQTRASLPVQLFPQCPLCCCCSSQRRSHRDTGAALDQAPRWVEVRSSRYLATAVVVAAPLVVQLPSLVTSAIRNRIGPASGSRRASPGTDVRIGAPRVGYTSAITVASPMATPAWEIRPIHTRLPVCAGTRAHRRAEPAARPDTRRAHEHERNHQRPDGHHFVDRHRRAGEAKNTTNTGSARALHRVAQCVAVTVAGDVLRSRIRR